MLPSGYLTRLKQNSARTMLEDVWDLNKAAEPSVWQQRYESVKAQIHNNSLFDLENVDVDNTEKFFEWLTTNMDACFYLGDDKFADNVPDEEFQKLRRDTAELRAIIEEWNTFFAGVNYKKKPENGEKSGYIVKNGKKYKVVDIPETYQRCVDSKGKLRDLSSAEPGSRDALARDFLNILKNKFKLYFWINSKERQIKDSDIIDNIINGTDIECPGIGKVDDIARMQLINMISNRSLNDPELRTNCKQALDTVLKKGDKVALEYAKGRDGRAISENVQKKSKLAEAQLETKKFRDTLRELKAASIHDSKQYKALLSIVDAVSQGKVEFFDKSGNRKPEYAALSDEQFAALPYIMIRDGIDTYLKHKAKDGVNRNAYKKLAAVEKLNQNICRKIKELNPEDFKITLSAKGSSQPAVLDFKKADVHVTYKDELNAAREALGLDPKDKNKLKEQLKTAENIAQPKANAIIIDTSSTREELKSRSNLSGKDLEALENVSSCMDRLMLKKQNNPKNIQNTIKTLCDGGIPEYKEIKDLFNVRNAFIKEPVKVNSAAAAEAAPRV